MKAAMEAYRTSGGKYDALVVNGRELMKAYQHVMLKDYFAADAERRKKILDERINEQQMMEAMRKVGEMASVLGRRDASPAERLSVMRQQIGDAIQDSMRNGTAEDRAMMTQFMLEMRARRAERGLKVLF